MRASGPRVRRWLGLGALCAFWVVGLAIVPARTARADCSHPERPAFGIDLTPDRAADPGARITPTAPAAPKPCSGPQCSGKSAPSSAPTAIPRVAPFAEAWAWLAAIAPPDQARSAIAWADEPMIHPATDPSSIFHPPRRSR